MLCNRIFFFSFPTWENLKCEVCLKCIVVSHKNLVYSLTFSQLQDCWSFLPRVSLTMLTFISILHIALKYPIPLSLHRGKLVKLEIGLLFFELVLSDFVVFFPLTISLFMLMYVEYCGAALQPRSPASSKRSYYIKCLLSFESLECFISDFFYIIKSIWGNSSFFLSLWWVGHLEYHLKYVEASLRSFFFLLLYLNRNSWNMVLVLYLKGCQVGKLAIHSSWSQRLSRGQIISHHDTSQEVKLFPILTVLRYPAISTSQLNYSSVQKREKKKGKTNCKMRNNIQTTVEERSWKQ